MGRRGKEIFQDIQDERDGQDVEHEKAKEAKERTEQCQYSPESVPLFFGKSVPRIFGQTRHPVEWQASEMAGGEGCE